jgi:hypothetical protein
MDWITLLCVPPLVGVVSWLLAASDWSLLQLLSQLSIVNFIIFATLSLHNVIDIDLILH